MVNILTSIAQSVLVLCGLVSCCRAFLGSIPSISRSALRAPQQQHLQGNVRREERLRNYASSTIAPPRAPTVAKRTGGGDGDGLRLMTADQVRVALAGFKHSAPKFCKTEADWEETADMVDRMRDWVDTIEGFSRMGSKRMTMGSYKSGRLLSIAALEVMWRGLPHGDVRLLVRLLAVNPSHSTRKVGFETLEALKLLGRDNALTLDCSALREIPCLRVFSLAVTKTLDKDPVKDPKALRYKESVRRTCFVVDDVPEWADLGPFWYEGRTPDGVAFWFRKRNPNQLSEFEVSFNHPEAGNATGSGTVGGARVIGYDELERCIDIAGRAKVIDIREALSQKLLAEAQRSPSISTSSSKGDEFTE